MFTSTLFATVKTWKQLKCPSIDECIKKMSDIHRHIYQEQTGGSQRGGISETSEGSKKQQTSSYNRDVNVMYNREINQ